MKISLILAEKITELFLIMLMGYGVVRKGLLKSDDSRILSVVMVYLVTPCMIINSFQVDYTPQVRDGLIYALIIAAGIHILFLVLTKLLGIVFRLDAIEKCAVIYTNAGILVIPLVHAILGEEYVIYSCAFIVVQTILVWTHCTSLLCGDTTIHIKKIFTNINIWAIVVGMLLLLFRIQLPQLLEGTLSTVGAMIGPLGMMLAGMVIADADLVRLFSSPGNYIPAVLRLIIYPLIVLAILRLTGASGMIAGGKPILMTVYLAAITPACATVTSLAQLYTKKAAHSSALYVLSTLCCIITMPVMIGLFDKLIP